VNNVYQENQARQDLLNMLAYKMAEKKGNKIGIYIFGAGKGGQILWEYLTKLNAAGLVHCQIKGIFDNDVSKYEGCIGDLTITAPSKETVGINDFVIIASLNYCQQIYSQLLEIGIAEEQIIFDRSLLMRLLNKVLESYIDIVDTCNLACATCYRGRSRGTANKMTLEIFCKILDRLKAANYSTIGLYNWTEPFLHPDLLSFVQEVKKRSFGCSLSSNLALPNLPQLIEVLDALNPDDGDHLLVSISGMSQSVYEINHRGGNIETVKKNIQIASQSKNKRIIRLKFLQFSYNLDEMHEMIEFCKQQGIGYEIIAGRGNPLAATSAKKVAPVAASRPLTSLHYCRTLKSLSACALLFDNMVIDAAGDMYLCCATPLEQSYNLGSFLEQDLPALTLKKFFHPACATCSLPLSRRNFSDKDLDILFQGLKQAGEKWYEK